MALALAAAPLAVSRAQVPDTSAFAVYRAVFDEIFVQYGESPDLIVFWRALDRIFPGISTLISLGKPAVSVEKGEVLVNVRLETAAQSRSVWIVAKRTADGWQVSRRTRSPGEPR